MFVPHPLDLIAILLGIFLAIRKGDTRAEDASRHPHVAIEVFRAWQAQAIAAYTLGIRACFLRVVLDFGLVALFRRVSVGGNVQFWLGFSVDLAWAAAMLGCWLMLRRAKRAALDARIDLWRPVQSSGDNPS